MVEDKIRMCDVLSDIEVAQDMLDPKQEEDQEVQPHPADEKYATLMADLKVISPEETEYKIIDKYCKLVRLLSACFRGNRLRSPADCCVVRAIINSPMIGICCH